nr:NAD-binding protein [Mycoplasmopsis bovis]
MAKKRNQDICIIGTGRFGSAVIGQLAKMDCSLLLVDSDEHVLNEYKDVAQKIVVADATNIKAYKSLEHSRNGYSGCSCFRQYRNSSCTIRTEC